MNRTPGAERTDLEIVNRFAISLLRQNSIDDLLWSMAANLGEVLGFEDCVIYLCQGEELVQSAAYGVKSPGLRNIKNEISIKLGQGIVGSVALSGKTEYIANLSTDSRYIQDEFCGQSELAVPLIAEGRVIGVLDSESSQLNGFDQHDLDMLESLANIAAPRIASAMAQLEKEKAQRAMREAKLEAERANRAKSEFLSRMSHELKTPLNAVLGFTNLIKIESGQNYDPRLDKILFSGQHLLDLINESLDVVRVEQNAISLDIQSVNISEVFAECVAMLQPDAEKNQVTLKVITDDLLLDTDHQRMRQVMLNLISNAIKYNHKQGEVVISARVQDASQVEIAVEDSGIGMSAADLSQLFQPFTRFGEQQTRIEGHGIGMMITRQLIQAMDGQIEVTSEPGKGTRVVISIPKQRRQSVA